MGELTGGSEKRLSVTSTNDECAHLVRRTEPNANGASRDQFSGACYAEFATTNSDRDANYQHCVFGGKLERDFKTIVQFHNISY